ncbi:MAG: Ig-like domain-containing protein, partial [Bacteroidota bacterium]
GNDSFTFKVNDGEEDSDLATVTITITPVDVNEPPVAFDQTVNVELGSSVFITLTGNDPDSDPINFVKTSDPTKGNLQGTAPNFEYTPNPGASGSDSFTFEVNDGDLTSNEATVTINILPASDCTFGIESITLVDANTNQPLFDILDGQTISLQDVGTDLNIIAIPCNEGEDVNRIVLQLTGEREQTRTEKKAPYALFGDSNGDYSSWPGGAEPGEYSLTATPFDDDLNAGTPLTVNFTFQTESTGGNIPPIANAQNVSTPENTPVNITLSGSDADGDPITFVDITQPQKGQLSGTAPNLTYTPNQGATGSDSFTFKVNDGQVNSSTATVSIEIIPGNRAPIANSQSVTTPEGQALAITLTGSDPDGDPIDFVDISTPQKGQLSGTAPNLTYTPNQGATGSDSFTFKVNDGDLNSNTATISIEITSEENSAPIANSQAVTTPQGQAVAITLTGSDPDGDPITFVDISTPQKGQLSGTAPNLTYTPNQGATGSDSFTFKVNDGDLNSNTATVSITILATACENTVTELVLYDSDTDQVLRTMTDNMLIDLSLDGDQLAIVAEACNTDKVVFVLEYPDGSEYNRTESKAPYALYGDKNGDFSPIKDLVPGDYVIHAVPYVDNVAGTSISYAFEVVNSASDGLEGQHNTFDKLNVTLDIEPVITAFPVPFNDEVTLNFKHADNGRVLIEVFSMDGRLILDEQFEKDSLEVSYTIKTNSLSEGIYMVRLRQGEYQEVIKVSKVN